MLGLDLLFGDDDTPQSSAPSVAPSSRPTLGPSKPNSGRNATEFTGLANQGATCYLNSVIQSLYALPPFREAILALSRDELNWDEMPVKSEMVADFAAQPISGFSVNENQEIGDIFSGGGDDFGDDSPEIGDIFGDPVSSSFERNPVEKIQTSNVHWTRRYEIPIQLQRLFASMAHEDSSEVTTSDLTRAFGWSGNTVNFPQDVHELLRLLLDAIERTVHGTRMQGRVEELSSGEIVYTTRCSCGNCRYSTDAFRDVVLPVHATLEQSLAVVNESQFLTDVSCSACNQRTNATRETSFRILPPILTFALARFTYDWKTNGRVKIRDKCEFPFELNMDPFVEGYVVGGDARPGTKYLLYAVIAHRGSVYSGHYVAYVKGNEGWVCLNDGSVASADIADIASTYGSASKTETDAYLLMYLREDSVSQSVAQPPVHLQQHLQDEVDKRNAELAVERAAYDLHINTVGINVLSRECIKLNQDGSIVPVKADAGTMIRIDARQPVSELWSVIASSTSGSSQEFASGWPHTNAVMNVVQRRGRPDRLHIGRCCAVEGSEVIKSDPALARGGEVYVWNGQGKGSEFGLTAPLGDGGGVHWFVTVDAYFNTEDEPLRLIVMTRENAPVEHLARSIVEQLGDNASLILAGQDVLDVYLLRGSRASPLKDPTSLYEAGLHDGACVAVEAHGGSLIATAHSQSTKLIEVFATVRVDDVSSISVSIDPFADIGTLKEMILAQIPPAIAQQGPWRLRRGQFGGGDGELFSDESGTLQGSGVAEGTRVVLEQGESPNLQLAAYRACLVKDGKRDPEQIDVMIRRGASIAEAKVAISREYGIDASGCRLRGTNLFDAATAQLSDESLNLIKTLSEGSLILLEYGLPPVRGAISLRICIWSPPTPVRIGTPIAQLSMLMSPAGGGGELRSAYEVSKHSSGLEVREELCTEFRGVVTVPVDRVRLWSNNKLLRTDETPLKRLHVNSGASVVLEIMDSNDLVGHPQHDDSQHHAVPLVIYVYTRSVEAGSLVFNGAINLSGATPVLQDLVRGVEAISGIVGGSLAKLFPHDYCWRNIPTDVIGSVRSKPLSLKDGDVIVVTPLDQLEVGDSFAIAMDAPAPHNVSDGSSRDENRPRDQKRAASPQLRIALPSGV